MAVSRPATSRTTAQLRGRTALARFAGLLKRHLANGARPNTSAIEPWSFAAFARELDGFRHNPSLSARSVSNWCNGRAMPAAIDPIIQALFGPEGNSRHTAAREELRAAYQAAWAERHSAIIAGAPPIAAAPAWT